MVKLGIAYTKGQTFVKIMEQTELSDDDYDLLGYYIETGCLFIKMNNVDMSEIARNFSEAFMVEVSVKQYRLGNNGFDFKEFTPRKKRKRKSFKQLRFSFS